jgi:hypothetical protein
MSNEIDLHGLQAFEAIQRFIEFYNRLVKAGNRSSINVIHGYGSTGEGGIIRQKLRNFLASQSDNLRFQTGEEIDARNCGRTIVFPIRTLPTITDILSQEIIAYCKVPRTKTKISGKFRKYGEEQIQKAVRNMEKLSFLYSFYKGKYKVYCTESCTDEKA